MIEPSEGRERQQDSEVNHVFLSYLYSDGLGPPQTRADDIYVYVARLGGRDVTCEIPLKRMDSTVSLYETTVLFHSTVSPFDTTVKYHCTAL